MIYLKEAEEKDLTTIGKLAQVIWNDHYVGIIGQEQVDYMLDKMYSNERLIEQLNIKKHVFYLVNDGDVSLGFISVSSENISDYFLHKFYINQQKSNVGLGTIALNVLIEKIKPKSLILTVNRQNYKSINFYFKNHFKIDRIEDFDIGDGYVMNDFVMVRKF